MNPELKDYVVVRGGELYWKKKPAQRSRLDKPIGTVNSRGYLCMAFKGKHYLVHRVIFWLENGYLPEQVDHKFGDRLDNAPCNTRASTNQTNAQNRKKIGVRSKYKGVNPLPSGRFQARITKPDKQRISLGTFETENEAGQAYNDAATKYFGEFARLNVLT